MTSFDPRAALFVPANSEKLLESALKRRPDAIILDLEDGVADTAKHSARATLASFQSRCAAAAIPVAIRVNASSDVMALDIAALDPATLAALFVPKCEDDTSLTHAAALLDQRGGNPACLIAMIETPRGIDRLSLIARTKNLIGLMFGTEDYMAAMDIPPSSAGLDVPASLIALMARSHNLIALGIPGSIGNFADLDLYRSVAKKAREMGFAGGVAIHPTQIEILRDAFRPSEKDITEARRAIEAFEDGLSKGLGVIALDGKMLDAPVIARARRILARL